MTGTRRIVLSNTTSVLPSPTLFTSTLTRKIRALNTLRYILRELFEDRSVAISVKKRQQLGKVKLRDGGDARAHINKMLTFREELACMGKPVSDEDYFNMVFMSLPSSYNPILTSMSTNMRLLNCQLTSQQLISQVLDKYGCFSIQKGSKSKPKDDDVAFTTNGKKGHG